MLGAKFESGIFSGFGDMSSHNSRSRIGIFTTENRFHLKIRYFRVYIRCFRPKVDPHVNFSNFLAEEIVSFSKFLRPLYEKRAAAPPPPPPPPPIDQFRACPEDEH